MGYIYSCQSYWRIDKDDPSKIRCGDELVAEVHTTEDTTYPEYELEANARLVANAPRIYQYMESLAAIVHMYLDLEDTDPDGAARIRPNVKNIADGALELERQLRLTYTQQRTYELHQELNQQLHLGEQDAGV